MTSQRLQDRQTAAKAWFDSLRDRICAAFELLEDEAPGELYPGEPGRFELTAWDRAGRRRRGHGHAARPLL